MADDKPIIIVKKKGGHGGHHGGAWKVAYADFVTAMMAFFMVMWLVNSAETATKQNIASYFRKPGLFASGSGTPLLIGEAGILPDAYTPPQQTRDKVKGKETKPTIPDKKSKKELETEGTPADEPVKLKENKGAEQAELQELMKAVLAQKKKEEKKDLEKLAQDIRQEMRKIPDLEKLLGDLEVKVESDGLVIEIMDTEKGSMFALSSAQITPSAETAFYKIADILSKYPNKLEVIGHTDAKPFSARKNGYSNWELSSDRANAARRVLLSAGIEETRLMSVVGRADRNLRNESKPLDPSNRRITLKMRFNADNATATNDLKSGLEEFEAIEQQQIEKRQNENIQDIPPVQEIPTTPESTATVDPYAGKYYLPWVANKRYNKKANAENPDAVKLPEDPDEQESASPADKADKIFSDSPVFGPATPFGNM